MLELNAIIDQEARDDYERGQKQIGTHEYFKHYREIIHKYPEFEPTYAKLIELDKKLASIIEDDTKRYKKLPVNGHKQKAFHDSAQDIKFGIQLYTFQPLFDTQFLCW